MRLCLLFSIVVLLLVAFRIIGIIFSYIVMVIQIDYSYIIKLIIIWGSYKNDWWNLDGIPPNSISY